jgi:hypothetical protein
VLLRMVQGMKIRVLSCFVAELKSASGNMQAAKAFDARLAGLSEEFAKAAGLEAVLPSWSGPFHPKGSLPAS